jgi:uncharacterized iron-regulated membrane protein
MGWQPHCSVGGGLMLAQYARRFHRWLTFVFAIPLAVVVGTGLVLSFEPAAQQIKPAQPIELAKIENLLARHDPARAARSLSIRTIDNTLTLGGVGPEGSIVIDLGSGETTTAAQSLARLFLTARRMHETLLLDLGWLVTASTIAMLVVAGLGLLMGWPRFRNSLSGWHQGVAWVALPLIVLSPLTGLALAYGITFTAPPPRSPDGGRVTILDAVRLVAAEHDLANLTAIRQRGRMLMARIYVNGELRGYRFSAGRLDPMPRNWPRVIHEGNWGGFAGPLVNVATSLVILGLLATGPLIWLRRRIRQARTGTKAAAHPERAVA